MVEHLPSKFKPEFKPQYYTHHTHKLGSKKQTVVQTSSLSGPLWEAGSGSRDSVAIDTVVKDRGTCLGGTRQGYSGHSFPGPKGFQGSKRPAQHFCNPELPNAQCFRDKLEKAGFKEVPSLVLWGPVFPQSFHQCALCNLLLGLVPKDGKPVAGMENCI
jgi:hypothetical protein